MYGGVALLILNYVLHFDKVDVLNSQFVILSLIGVTMVLAGVEGNKKK